MCDDCCFVLVEVILFCFVLCDLICANGGAKREVRGLGFGVKIE